MGYVSTSAGVGRTGVFITLSIVLEKMRHEGVVDVFQTVKTLRTQRPGMVQTEVRCAVTGQHDRQEEFVMKLSRKLQHIYILYDQLLKSLFFMYCHFNSGFSYRFL